AVRLPPGCHAAAARQSFPKVGHRFWDKNAAQTKRSKRTSLAAGSACLVQAERQQRRQEDIQDTGKDHDESCNRSLFSAKFLSLGDTRSRGPHAKKGTLGKRRSQRQP